MKPMILFALAMVVVVAVLVFALPAFSQDQERPLAPDPDVGSLVNQLGSPDYQVRKQAEEQLLELGEEAVPTLEKARREHKDAHVRFEAERLLHRIGAAKADVPPRVQNPRFGDMEERLNEILKRLEEFGVMPPEEMDKLLRGWGGGSGQHSGATVRGSVLKDGRQIEYEQEADGKVRVKITENGETKTFEADSLEEFKKQEPEIFKLVQPFFGGVRIQIGEPSPFPRGFGLRPGDWPRGFGSPPPERLRPETPRVPGGFRLGVWVGEIGEALRAHLKLRLGQGVLVEEVVPGSLAHDLGILKFDVIVKINGQPVGSAEAIRRILSEVPEGGQVEAEVVRHAAPLKLISKR